MAAGMASETAPNPLTLPPVVKALFRLLPAKSLCTVASVCQLWRSEAQMCLQRRRQYSWQFFEDGSGLVVLQHVQRYFEDIPFRPSTVVIFMTMDLWNWLGHHQLGHKRRHGDHSCRVEWKKFCKNVLPSGCQVFCSITSGIVGTSSDLSYTTEKDFGSSVSLVCFGQYPGLRVSLQKSRGTVIRTLKNTEQEKPDGEDVKLLLLMSCFASTCFTVDDIRRELPRTLIVGGIITVSCVHGVPVDPSRSGRCGTTYPYCVVFQGRDVKVACVKLDEAVAEEGKAEEVIERLKEKTRAFPLERSLAFMYACLARGYHLYSKHNVETSLFRKHFPHTPLLGLFGNGEIGCDFPFPDGLGEGARDGVDLQHAYTTFIAVVSLP
ncbi:F-box only protein 22-like [Babylonia areolata]|uniref:F-box only protein 22-like n=1 Tax=Babylonia areolata TaxID=304850 RepID=UPI003FD24556